MQATARRPTFLRSLNCDGVNGVALLAVLAVLLLPLAGGDALRELWRYERGAVLEGEWWRLATAHVTHLDLRHALFNAAGLALLWALFARSFSWLQWIGVVWLCALVIDAGFILLSPDLVWYVGASALLHGVFACGCIAWIRGGDRMGFVAIAALAAKLAWENLHGPLPFMAGQPVVTISHAYGAAGGVLAGLLLRPRREPLY